MKFYKDGHTEINFNPRSREGSDKSSQSLSNAVNQISIHAPAKGATCSSDNLFPSQSISIHAPAKGATDSAHNLRFIHVFQSTLPRRERLFESYGICFRVDISIHAPAKGATPFATFLSNRRPAFQSTLPRRERRHKFRIIAAHFRISIHAPAKGATAMSRSTSPLMPDFNPRSREGSD